MGEHGFTDLVTELGDQPSVYDAITALSGRVESLEAMAEQIREDHAAILDAMRQIIRIIRIPSAPENSS